MAVSVEKYKDLNYALRKLRTQIIDGLPYAMTECPRFNSPEEIFTWLKQRTVYKKDPKNRELFQCLPTLLEKDLNKHGVPGAGDCDCFTIAALTLLTANGFHNLDGDNCGIVLVGRNRFVPVHIYVYANTKFGNQILDLTNQWFDYERPGYNYYQEIPFKLNPLEEKNMILELAEGIEEFLSGKRSAAKKNNPSPRKQRRNEVKDAKHTQKINKYKDIIPLPQDNVSPELDTKVTDNYTYLPEQDIHVRNDVYDDLSPAEFQDAMLEEGVPVARILELSGARAARKKLKASTKATGKLAKAKKKSDKGEAAKGKAEAKKLKGARPKMTPEQKAKLFDKAGNFIKTVTQKGGAASRDDDDDTRPTAGSNRDPKGTPKSKADSEDKETITVFGKEFTPMQVGLGATGILLLLGGAAYAVKKRK
jgi:hypothetical protein